jgi:hypothetical protein
MKKPVILILSALFLLSSCSRYYYVADTQNIPLFREKNEYRLSGAFGFGDESKAIEVQSAYSISDNIGVMANLMHAWGGDIQGKDYGRGTCIDGGIGYFKPIKNYGVFEIYGGLGGCVQHHEYTGLRYNSVTGSIYTEYDGNSRVASMKLFLQPSFGVTYSVFDFILSTRISSISFMSLENNVFGNTYDFDELNSLSEHGQFFIEPAGTLRGGWDNFKLQGQASYIWHLNDHDYDINEEAHFSVGLVFIFPKKIKQ